MENKQKILIVDDDPFDIDVLRHILETDYVIAIATHGTGGLRLARATVPPDLILLDVMMLDINGYEVCRNLKSSEETRNIPVMFITGKNSAEDETMGLGLGAIDYITKPFTPSVVQARVKTHLALHAAHAQLKQQYVALQEMDRLRKDVEAIMRHDLKSPINGIIGCADLMVQHENMSKDDMKRFSKMILDSARRLQEMINMSLSLMQMEQGRYTAVLQPINLFSVVERILADCRVWMHKRQIHTMITIDGHPVQDQPLFTVLGDATLCYTMLSNLFKNAVEASNAGQTVTIALHNGTTMATIALHNQGVVPATIREQFFEKYVTYGKKGGTGLGTYSARLMAKIQHGDISLNSSEMEGTTITVRLRQGLL